MDGVMTFVNPGRHCAKDSIWLVKRCTKPDRKVFQKIAIATAIGFAVMGFIGFFVKLIHIPINIMVKINWSSTLKEMLCTPMPCSPAAFSYSDRTLAADDTSSESFVDTRF
ncbi:protein transport protein Sec61 gamma-1 subunit-like [Lethenteron reissneri]|uniref:protein transport protein Sec61 gamma-1 subunit-like n=1 Tax=Lethenteron reissneri TaxID=7753 RepID=UPI002AB74B4D|nr:protein transport protein Sec61 gamma-1 subunit-like [Lethenteron reissneri]